MRRAVIAVALLLLLLPIASATSKQGTITLLTVSEPFERRGGTAEMHLVIKPGSGSIFLDSLPLTKLDTQISTRYANQIACDFIDADCSQYDFFYRIRADSSIVGGPSAGAAISVLTVATLTDTPLRKDVAITGTINSGGLIGPVAGISEKAAAAKAEGITTVLVPSFEIPTNGSNQSVEGVAIVKVGSLAQALNHYTDRNWSKPSGDIEIPNEYEQRMQEVAGALCRQSERLAQEALAAGIVVNDSANHTIRAERAAGERRWYTQASLCFSRNLVLQRALMKDLSRNERLRALLDLRVAIKAFEVDLEERELRTISDLQTFIVVHERLRDANDAIDPSHLENITNADLAYATERLASARAWSRFFGMQGRQLTLEREYLADACRSKIGEAEERISYVHLYLPDLLATSEQTLSSAYDDLRDENHALCLFRASKAKAEANVLASVIGLDKGSLDEVVHEKLSAVESVLLEQQRRDLFPILGYSYFEYSQSLLGFDDASALTFAEYALEMSNLSPYFPRMEAFSLRIDTYLLGIFLVGVGCGILASLIVVGGARLHTRITAGRRRPPRRTRRG